MKKINVRTHQQTAQYPIIVGTDILHDLPTYVDFAHYSHVLIVTDEHVAEHWLPTLSKAVPIQSTAVVLPAGEQAKHLQNLERLWSAMQSAKCDRKSLVIALGGGVIGDMAGFAAATYMRGVDCLHIPTTLLAQIDSSVGGKTAIDFGGVKNVVGTFSQPIAVIIDTQTLRTLPKREFFSGFAEIIKHGLIRDATYLAHVTSKQPDEFTPAELENIIATSCRIKATVVEHDETESGERKILNFGHTVGHAIEALSLETAHPLLHGEAVSIGMAIEAELSARQSLLSVPAAAAIQSQLAQCKLPIQSPHFALARILEKLRSDKKNEHGILRFTLLQRPGHAVWNQDVTEAVVRAVLKQHMEQQT
jgi:3-dehydroquinate synthase